MEQFVPDNKYLKELAELVDDLHKTMKKDLDLLRDENGDMFMRYMSFCRTRTYMSIVAVVMENQHRSMIAGNDLSHPIFHTDAHKDKGWDEIKLKKNPFFINKNKNDDERQIPKELKHALAGAIFGAIANHVMKK